MGQVVNLRRVANPPPPTTAKVLGAGDVRVKDLAFRPCPSSLAARTASTQLTTALQETAEPLPSPSNVPQQNLIHKSKKNIFNSQLTHSKTLPPKSPKTPPTIPAAQMKFSIQAKAKFQTQEPPMTDRQKRRREARKLAKKDKKEISPAQLAANQANAQLSSGPSTPEGKAISSQNNFRHGLTQTEGDLILLEGESQEAYAKSLADFQKEWQPATATEHDLVERLANRRWLRRRALKLQNQFLAPDGTITNEKQYALYHRYEAQHERAYNKALSDLIRLRSLHLREQNGFESQKRKDEIHTFKIKALKDREYRNQLQILEREARLTLAQAKLNQEHLMNTAPVIPEPAKSAAPSDCESQANSAIV